MKKYYEFSLQKYSVMAGVFIIMQNNSIAQVIYTDIEPDIILDEGGEDAELDMNEDDISDFLFHNNSFQYYDTSWLSVRTMKNILAGPDEVGNALAGISNYFNTGYNGFTWYYPFALEQYVAINEELTWQSIETQLIALRVYSDGGAFVAAGVNCYWSETETIDKYLGVKFKDLDNQLHYGWIRCDVLDEGRTLIIKDYAYESQPEHPILAGDTTHFVSVFESTNNINANVYSDGNSIYVNLDKLHDNLTVSVFDITGKEIYSNSIHKQFSSFVLDQPANIYLIKISSNKGGLTKKIYIK